jgi:hypothetical protein
MTEEYLDNDSPILGQSYVCLSFISPDKIIKQKEMYCFHKYMTNKFKEYAELMDRALDKNNGNEGGLKKLERDLKERTKLEFSYNYEQFKSNYGDFMYKHESEINEKFNKEVDFKTSVRGLKVRGVYETYKEAEIRAKALQRRDRSFHVYVGTVGAWLPWNPEADKIQNEEYLEDELNTLIQEYKKNQVHKDMLYEQEKQDRKTDIMKKKIAEEELEKQEAANKDSMATIESKLEQEDPWMQRSKEETPAIAADTPAADK